MLIELGIAFLEVDALAAIKGLRGTAEGQQATEHYFLTNAEPQRQRLQLIIAPALLGPFLDKKGLAKQPVARHQCRGRDGIAELLDVGMRGMLIALPLTSHRI
ncbi:hypothetical protein [Bradyrhizobium sp. USDA 4516]